MGAKSSVKLACKQIFVPIFSSDEHPMLLDLETGQEDCVLKTITIL